MSICFVRWMDLTSFSILMHAVVVLVTRTVICRAISLDESTFGEAEQGGNYGRVENLSTLES
eukprot:scaffold192_cov331-Pavlova_lutheri.AAC.2